MSLQGRLESDFLEMRRRWRERSALGGRGRQRARRVLPLGRPSRRRRRRRGAGLAPAGLLRSDGAREAPLAGQHGGAAPVRLVGRPPRHFVLDDAADLRLARVRFPYRENVPALRGQGLRFGLVLGEVARARRRLDRLVLFDELDVDVDDVVSGALRQYGRAASALRVGPGGDVRVLLAFVGAFSLGARVERRPRRRRRFGPETGHRQLKTDRLVD